MRRGMSRLCLCLGALLASFAAFGKEDHSLTQEHADLEAFRNNNGSQCCGDGDFHRLNDADWWMRDGVYWARIGNKEYKIPEHAYPLNAGIPLGTTKGQAVIFYDQLYEWGGDYYIRCFQPGNGA